MSPGTKTIEQIRTDIDRGSQGDKIPYIDPAAAPLGADDEAAGHPITPQEITHLHINDEIQIISPVKEQNIVNSRDGGFSLWEKVVTSLDAVSPNCATWVIIFAVVIICSAVALWPLQ